MVEFHRNFPSSKSLSRHSCDAASDLLPSMLVLQDEAIIGYECFSASEQRPVIVDIDGARINSYLLAFAAEKNAHRNTQSDSLAPAAFFLWWYLSAQTSVLFSRDHQGNTRIALNACQETRENASLVTVTTPRPKNPSRVLSARLQAPSPPSVSFPATPPRPRSSFESPGS